MNTLPHPPTRLETGVALILGLIGALVAVVLLILVIRATVSTWGQPNEVDIRREIAQELPPGTPGTQVEAWFQRKGFHYGYVDTATNGGRPAYYGSTLRDIGWDLFAVRVLIISISVDDAKTVTGTTVEMHHDGL